MKALIWIDGRGIGKARPRSTAKLAKVNGKLIAVSGKPFMPKKYREWANHAIAQISKQRVPVFEGSVSVECHFVNFLSSDSDNITGSVLDALVKCQVIENDSSKYVVKSTGGFVKLKKLRGIDKPIGILVKIESCDRAEIDSELADFIHRFGYL